MAVIFGVGTTITDNFTATEDESTYLIQNGETLHGTTDPAFDFGDADGTTLLVRGTIESTFSNAVMGLATAEGSSVRVGRNGLISGTDTAVDLGGVSGTLTVRGRVEVASVGATAVVMGGADMNLVNHGTIFGTKSFGSAGVLLGSIAADDSYTLENDGRIVGGTGVLSEGAFAFSADNTGSILGATTGIKIDSNTQHAHINNDGLIKGGIYGLQTWAHETVFINGEDGILRSGAASAKSLPPAEDIPAAFKGGSLVQDILNAGRIEGDVYFGGGNDTYFGLGDGVVTGKVWGEGGDDTLIGSTARDVFDGGLNDDTLEGRGGNDKLFGDNGDDGLVGGAGNDTLRGGDGEDGLLGGAGRDKLFGELGDDILHAGDGNDRLFGGGGMDVLNGEGGDDKLFGGAGIDTLFGEAGNDLIDGGDDGDTVLGGAGKDAIDGGSGDDDLSGDSGNDRIDGGVGGDTLHGDSGNDTLRGGDGGDTLLGDAGKDKLFGGTGDDYLEGGAGNDKLFGDGGKDDLMADGGNDRLTGGAGADNFMWADWVSNLGHDTVLDWQDGLDMIDISYFAIDDLGDFLADALSRDGADALIDMSFADTLDPGHYTGIIRIVGAWGQISEADFVPLI